MIENNKNIWCLKDELLDVFIKYLESAISKNLTSTYS